MFPYCSIIFFIATIIGFIITLKLFFIWRAKKDENIGYFLKAMMAGTIYFFLATLPGAIVKDHVYSAAIFIFAWIPLYITLFYFTRLALHFWRLEKMKNILLIFVVLLIIFITFFNLLYFEPTEEKSYKNLSVCFERSPSWILQFCGIMATLMLLINSALFFRGGIKSQEKTTKIRGLTIGIGLFSIAISVFFKYVIAPYWQETQVFIFYAGPLFLLGILAVYFGIQYKRLDNVE